jgi:hypothetical protein
MPIGERDQHPEGDLRNRSEPWADLVLTLPIFVGYHLGVIQLPVRNAADVVTRELVVLANNSMLSYFGLTLGIGAAFAGTLVLLGRGRSLHWGRFAFVAAEGVLYAVAMRLIASYVVGHMYLARSEAVPDRLTGLVMSLGAGFYEEIAFRVLLYGLGARLLLMIGPRAIPFRNLTIRLVWAAIAAAVFSGWHYIGALGDAFDLQSFVFRWVCGMVFTAIYELRGFAPAVWTHTIYDVWVMAL